MGEKAGHPFRGNQFTSSKGGGKGGGKSGAASPERAEYIRKQVEAAHAGGAKPEHIGVMVDTLMRTPIAGIDEMAKSRLEEARRIAKPGTAWDKQRTGDEIRADIARRASDQRRADLGAKSERMRIEALARQGITVKPEHPENVGYNDKNPADRARLKAQVKAQIAKDNAKFTALKNSEKKAKKMLERQNSMAGVGNKAEITPDLISRAATARGVKAAELRESRKVKRIMKEHDAKVEKARVGTVMQGVSPSTVVNPHPGNNPMSQPPSYEARRAAAGRGSAFRSTWGTKGYGHGR